MMVSYRMNGASGTVFLANVNDLQLAFNRVVQKLELDASHIGKSVRYEGKVKIGRKSYAAISQAGLIVVKDGPGIPDRVELQT
jgi:hypothetical protein